MSIVQTTPNMPGRKIEREPPPDIAGLQLKPHIEPENYQHAKSSARSNDSLPGMPSLQKQSQYNCIGFELGIKRP